MNWLNMRRGATKIDEIKAWGLLNTCMYIDVEVTGWTSLTKGREKKGKIKITKKSKPLRLPTCWEGWNPSTAAALPHQNHKQKLCFFQEFGITTM